MNTIGEKQNHQRHWDELEQAAHHRRYHNWTRRNGCDFEPAQDVLFAVHHRLQRRAKESTAHCAEGQHRCHNTSRRCALSRAHKTSEQEEEDQWEAIAKNEGRAIPHGEADAHPDLCEISLHDYSRSFFPVSSMNTSSSVGRFKWMSSSSIPDCSTQRI